MSTISYQYKLLLVINLCQTIPQPPRSLTAQPLQLPPFSTWSLNHHPLHQQQINLLLPCFQARSLPPLASISPDQIGTKTPWTQCRNKSTSSQNWLYLLASNQFLFLKLYKIELIPTVESMTLMHRWWDEQGFDKSRFAQSSSKFPGGFQCWLESRPF